MRILIAALASACLAVTGCQTLSPTAEAKIKAASLKACTASHQMEAAYTVLKDAGELKPSLIVKGDKAFLAMNTFCNSSQDWEPENAALQVALLYVQVASILKQAKA